MPPSRPHQNRFTRPGCGPRGPRQDFRKPIHPAGQAPCWAELIPQRWSPLLPTCCLLTPVQTLWPLLPHRGLPSPPPPPPQSWTQPRLSDALGPTCLPGSEPLTCSPSSLCPCSLPPEGLDLASAETKCRRLTPQGANFDRGRRSLPGLLPTEESSAWRLRSLPAVWRRPGHRAGPLCEWGGRWGWGGDGVAAGACAGACGFAAHPARLPALWLPGSHLEGRVSTEALPQIVF